MSPVPDRFYFLLGDVAANVLVGALVGVVCAAIVSPGWNMFVSMLGCMVLGMLLASLLAVPLMRWFGAMEVMVPTMLGGMLSGMAQSAMEQNDTMTAKEKAEAREVLSGVTDFLSKADIGSSKNAEKAIGVLCRTARRLKLETLDDVGHAGPAQERRHHRAHRGVVAVRGQAAGEDELGAELIAQWIDSL